MSTYIEKSTVVDTPARQIWDVFADFGGVNDWHPYFEKAYLEDEERPRGVGAARICEFGPKMAIRETVTHWSDNDRMEIAIDFVRGMAPPIRDIIASVRVEDLEPGQSRLTLTMKYNTRLGPIGWLANKLFVISQYEQVFDNMLPAAKAFAETGRAPEQIAMTGSGRMLA